MLRSNEAAFARIDGAIEGFTAFYNLRYADTLDTRLYQRVHVRTLFQAAVHSVFLHVVLQLHHAAGQNARVRVAQDSTLFEGGRIATVIQLAMELSDKTEEMKDTESFFISFSTDFTRDAREGATDVPINIEGIKRADY